MWASACRAPQGGGTLVSTGQGQASPQAPAEGDQGTGGAGRRAPLGDRDGARPGAPSVCRGGRRGGLCSDQELSSHQESYHRGVHSSEPPLPGLSAERLSNWPRVTRPLSAAGSYDGKNAGLPQGSYVRISALPLCPCPWHGVATMIGTGNVGRAGTQDAGAEQTLSTWGPVWSGSEGGAPGSPAWHPPAAGCHLGATQSQGLDLPPPSTPEPAALGPGQPRSGGLGAR